jgi:hypothetical protein
MKYPNDWTCPPGSYPGLPGVPNPSGVSFSPEKEQSELPLLMLVPGGEGTFPVGGGPRISPASTGAVMRAVPMTNDVARRNFFIAGSM